MIYYTFVFSNKIKASKLLPQIFPLLQFILGYAKLPTFPEARYLENGFNGLSDKVHNWLLLKLYKQNSSPWGSACWSISKLSAFTSN